MLQAQLPGLSVVNDAFTLKKELEGEYNITTKVSSFSQYTVNSKCYNDFFFFLFLLCLMLFSLQFLPDIIYPLEENKSCGDQNDHKKREFHIKNDQ